MAALAAVLLVAVWSFWLKASRAEREAEAAKVIAIMERNAKRQAEVNKQRLNVDRVGRAYDGFRLTYDAREAESLVNAVEAEYLGWEWNFVRSAWGFPVQAGCRSAAGAPREISTMAVSEDGKLIATAGYESKSKDAHTKNAPTTIKVWEVTGSKLSERQPGLPNPHAAAVTALAFSRDGELASGDATGKLIVWKRESAGDRTRAGMCRSDPARGFLPRRRIDRGRGPGRRTAIP